VGIGEYLISNDIDDSLKTYALSSCVAVTAYSPFKNILGLAHIVLPYSNTREVISSPAYYADIAVPLMIKRLCREYGCSKGELVFHLYGGAESIKKSDFFNIGRRNINAVKAILTSYNVNFNDEETGGKDSRTIEVDVATGNVKIYYNRIII
jgi:chemotaxis protein CheD